MPPVSWLMAFGWKPPGISSSHSGLSVRAIRPNTTGTERAPGLRKETWKSNKKFDGREECNRMLNRISATGAGYILDVPNLPLHTARTCRQECTLCSSVRNHSTGTPSRSASSSSFWVSELVLEHTSGSQSWNMSWETSLLLLWPSFPSCWVVILAFAKRWRPCIPIGKYSRWL